MDTEPPDIGDTSADQPPLSPRKRRDSIEITSCCQESCNFSERDDNKFQCNGCKRYVHYRCTGLPLYQIQQFLAKKYRNYVCITCTKIPEHLNHIIPRPPAPSRSKELGDLDAVIRAKEAQIHSLSETNRLLQEEVRNITEDLNNEKAKTSKGIEERTKLVAEAKIMKKGIADYENKITDYQKKQNTKAGDKGSLQNLAQIVSKKIEEVEKSLKLSILAEVDKCNKNFEEKLSEVATINKTYAESLSEDGSLSTAGAPVWSTTPTPTPDIRAIMREEENAKLADETDKKRRAANLIVHGVVESMNPDKEITKKHDSDFVNKLLGDLGLNMEPKATFRIGNAAGETRKRPIKVIMNSEAEKDSVMESLRKLKGNNDYKGISVTSDNTRKDRELIKEWATKAKEANENEDPDSQFEWKVRGTPKNGMSLKRFRKRDQQAQA